MSCLYSHFQREAWRPAIHTKTSFYCHAQGRLIFVWKAVHQTSLWYRRKFGNGISQRPVQSVNKLKKLHIKLIVWTPILIPCQVTVTMVTKVNKIFHLSNFVSLNSGPSHNSKRSTHRQSLSLSQLYSTSKSENSSRMNFPRDTMIIQTHCIEFGYR